MPVHVTEVATSDPDRARDALNDIYAPDQRIVFDGPTDASRFDLTVMRLGEVHTGRVRHSLTTRVRAQPFADLVTVWFMSGRMRWASAGEEVHFRPGVVVCAPTGAALSVDWSSVDVATLRIPMAAVQRLAQTHFDVPPTRFRFARMAPVSGAAARQWQTLTRYVHHTVAGALDMSDNPLLTAQMVDTVAASALAVFPNTTMAQARSPEPGRVAPAALRRAVAYIDGHAREPITVGDVAEAAGTTGRAVQAAFRRHLDTTPLAYQRRVRLEGAHRDLQAADPATATVTAIAASWGFGHGARFAQFYREQFGHTPRQTLRG